MRKYIIIFMLFVSNVIFAAGNENNYHLNGADMSIFWTIPFAGILLSIAIMPLIAPHFWHKNFGKISAFWALILILPMLFSYGLSITIYEILHVYLLEYFPFIILLLALYTISGGVRIKGSLRGTPVVNLIILIIGTFLASWMGTTGAAMLLIRPIIRANAWRKHKTHIIVFFIFLVANVGGSLTPLGDPPLFLGFLKGVNFFWTTKAMFLPMMLVVTLLLIVFYFYDVYYLNKEDSKVAPIEKNEKEPLSLEGSFNLILLFLAVFAVLQSGIDSPIKGKVIFNPMGIHIEFQNLLRDFLLLLLTVLSWTLTSKKIRKENQFTWFPIQEVAKLFAGIFTTIIPAIAILKAGNDGDMKSIIGAVSTSSGEPINIAYFWLTGILSSFLDNAPTYLVFFNTAGGDPSILTTIKYDTLLAISAGAVFMGANTYIGNAPNFMVKSIAESQNIEMPSFFGYMIKYSIPILIPIFIIVSLIFFL